MTDLALMVPIYSPTEGVLFSAYGLDRGYLACALSFEAARERLGAANQGSEAILLAFRLNQQQIVRAVSAKTTSDDGRRIVLEARDFEP
jgi:predicted secreted hydrolase